MNDKERIEKAEFNSNYGNHVIIKHIDGYETLFAHLQDIDVEVDQKVVTGEIIGTVGNTGMSNGPHLHFELRKDGKAIDPTPYIK